MSELSKRLRVGYTCADDDTDHCHYIDSCGHDDEVLELCDDHERLEAEHAGVTTDLEGVTLMLANTSFELRRLEGLLRAFHMDVDNAESYRAVLREAERLARTPA